MKPKRYYAEGIGVINIHQEGDKPGLVIADYEGLRCLIYDSWNTEDEEVVFMLRDVAGGELGTYRTLTDALDMAAAYMHRVSETRVAVRQTIKDMIE